MEIKGLTRLSALILEATFFEISCMCPFQARFSSMFSVLCETFAMICLAWVILTPSTLLFIVLSFKYCDF